ncbi:MAG: hypothetical protein IJI19_05115, partial [Ruminococcus sp.]|nr:hypothetical protein [Ruminococcus sp.]
ILTEIELDESGFPQRLKDLIAEMIELDKKDDWLNYSFLAEQLEVMAKLSYQAGKISYKEFDTLCLKYCGVIIE